MIEVFSLNKRIGQATVLDQVSFRCSPGRVTGLLGPNGAGKTTLLRTMLGLQRPTSGTATFNGSSYQNLRDPISVVGSVFAQSEHLERSGPAHLAMVASARGGIRHTSVDQLLEAVGLGTVGRLRIKNYSLGMTQRLSIATALSADPPIILLDEPFNGLDPAGHRWMRELLVSRAAKGGTVLVSSHLLADLDGIADDVVILDKGRVVAAQRRRSDGVPNPKSLEELFFDLTGDSSQVGESR